MEKIIKTAVKEKIEMINCFLFLYINVNKPIEKMANQNEGGSHKKEIIENKIIPDKLPIRFQLYDNNFS